MGDDPGREHGPQPAERSDGGLARLALLRDADPAALAAAAPAARWLSVGPGELVLDFGDTTDDVFFVAEGAVRVVVRTPLGQEVILGDLGGESREHLSVAARAHTGFILGCSGSCDVLAAPLTVGVVRTLARRRIA